MHIRAGENQARDFTKVRNLPYETLCISMLDLRMRSIIMAGWSGMSSDCQHDEEVERAKAEVVGWFLTLGV